MTSLLLIKAFLILGALAIIAWLVGRFWPSAAAPVPMPNHAEVVAAREQLIRRRAEVTSAKELATINREITKLEAELERVEHPDR